MIFHPLEGRKMKKITLCLTLIALSVSKLNAENKPSTIVGVMEDDRAELVNWKKGPSEKRVIRPLFEKNGGEWKTSTVHSEGITWTIAFDGKNAGTVKSKPNTRDHPLNQDTHSPELQTGQTLVMGKPSADFSGWQNTPFNRPLVIVSNGHFKDPDAWKPLKLSLDQQKLLNIAFRKEYPKAINCDENEIALPNPWLFKDTDIKTKRVYSSNKGDLCVFRTNPSTVPGETIHCSGAFNPPLI